MLMSRIVFMTSSSRFYISYCIWACFMWSLVIKIIFAVSLLSHALKCNFFGTESWESKRHHLSANRETWFMRRVTDVMFSQSPVVILDTSWRLPRWFLLRALGRPPPHISVINLISFSMTALSFISLLTVVCASIWGTYTHTATCSG